MIDLARNRQVSFKDNLDRIYRFELARISAAQWMRYFAAVVSGSEMNGREIVRSFDSSRARLELVEAALLSATGYKLPAGKTLDQIANWQQEIPVAHRTTIGDILTRVRARDWCGTKEGCEIGVESICLTALWESNDKGEMVQHSDLVHQFKTPSADQMHRYMRDLSRTRIVGGSRTGKTIDLGAQATLVELYDELIISVEGYEVAGRKLENADEIRREMDVYHKVVACEFMFVPAPVEEIEPLKVGVSEAR